MRFRRRSRSGMSRRRGSFRRRGSAGRRRGSFRRRRSSSSSVRKLRRGIRL